MSRFVFPIVLVFILVFAGSSYAANDTKVSPKWNYDLGSRINSLAVGDLGNGATELVVASDKGVFIFSGNGSIIKNYSVSFTPSVVYISDGKILVGSGDFKTTNITNPVFNFTDTDNIVQVPSVVYKTVRNLGDVYIISGNSPPKLFLPAGNWVRDIYASDMNRDSSLEYAIVTGGLNIDYIKTATLEDSKPILIKNTQINSDTDQCDNMLKFLNSLASDGTMVQCQFMEGQNYMDVNVTQGLNGPGVFHSEIQSNDDQCSEITDMIKSFYKNMSFQCGFIRLASSMGGGGKAYYSGYMDINYTQPPRLPKVWVYNTEELDSNNGSLLFFSSNGSVLLNQSFFEVPSYVSLVSFSSNTSKMLAFGSEPVNLTDLSGNPVYSYNSPEENYTVKALFMDSIRGEKINDVVAGFAANKFSGVFVLDRDGKLVWIYKVSSEDFKGLYYYDIDSDGIKEIILATNKGVYAIGNDGILKMSFNFVQSIDKLAVGDIDGNGYMDFAVASGQKAYVYEIDEKFIKSGLANRYYLGAKDSLALGNYEDAFSRAQKADDLFKNLSDESGVKMSESLLSDINKNLVIIRNETAASLYKNGRTEYYLGNYTRARDYLEKALEIYKELGDADGLTKTKNAIADLGNASDATSTTSIQVVETTSPTNITGPGPSTDVSQYVPLLVGVIILFLLVIVVKMWLGGRGGPKEESKERDVIQRS